MIFGCIWINTACLKPTKTTKPTGNQTPASILGFFSRWQCYRGVAEELYSTGFLGSILNVFFPM